MQTKLLFLSAFISMIIIVAACILGNGYEAYVNKNIKPLTINGIVITKFKEETGCFGGIVIKQSNHLDSLRKIFICTIQTERIWDYVMSGDSIYKATGSLNANIFRAGKEVSFKFPTSE